MGIWASLHQQICQKWKWTSCISTLCKRFPQVFLYVHSMSSWNTLCTALIHYSWISFPGKNIRFHCSHFPTLWRSGGGRRSISQYMLMASTKSGGKYVRRFKGSFRHPTEMRLISLIQHQNSTLWLMSHTSAISSVPFSSFNFTRQCAKLRANLMKILQQASLSTNVTFREIKLLESCWGKGRKSLYLVFDYGNGRRRL